MTKSNTHTTSNLYEASFLLARNFKIKKIDRSTGKKVLLEIEGKGITDAVNDYYNDGIVSGKALTDAYRTLKDRIFE